MENFDYKEYSLENLQKWVHDAINTDATPEQIVDAIIKALQENINYHTEQLNKNAHTIALLKSTHKSIPNLRIIEAKSQKDWDDFWKSDD